MSETEKLVSRLGIVAKQSAHRGCNGARVLFLNSPHHHAQVVRLDHHSDSQRLEHIGERLCDLFGLSLLNLQPSRKHVDYTRQLRQSDNSAVGNVGDVRFSIEGQHVMLAQ